MTRIDHEFEMLREAYLDGEMTAEQRMRFEQLLDEDPSRLAAWLAESQWLRSLRRERDSYADAAGDRFAGQIVERWHSERSRPVIGRVERVIAYVGAAAAIAALALTIWVMQPDTPDRAEHAVAPAATPSQSTDANPLSVLVREVAVQYDRQPARVMDAIEQTTSLLNLNRLIEALQAPAPGPNTPSTRDGSSVKPG